jgi:hypothetical protein
MRGYDPDGMRSEPEQYSQLTDGQAGIISRTQGIDSGIPSATIRSQVRGGRWRRLERGVYASFTGVLAREAVLWNALLRAGPDATFSHQTAAELYGLLRQPSPLVHITVPAERHPARWSKIPGVVIHRSTSLGRTRHPMLSPPRTRVEDTVLDLIEVSASFEEAYDWICRAIGERRTTAKRLRGAMDARSKFRWRRHIELALGDADEGALSLLELRYVRGVERPHGLPASKRQARVRQRTGSRYLDNLYEEYRACVEIDGTAAHPAAEQWRDKRRDRSVLVDEQIVVVRIGFLDLRNQERRCATAADVAKFLSHRGPPVGNFCPRSACPVAGPP